MPQQNNGRATLREVYEITNRLDDKIDRYHMESMAEIAAIKAQIARITGYAAGIGGAAGFVAWIITNIVA